MLEEMCRDEQDGSGHFTREQMIKMGIDASEDFVSSVAISGFSPENVKVSLDGNHLKVSAHQEWKSEDGGQMSSRSFSRSLKIPETVKLDTLKTKMLPNGQMLIHGEQKPKVNPKSNLKSIPIEVVEEDRQRSNVEFSETDVEQRSKSATEEATESGEKTDRGQSNQEVEVSPSEKTTGSDWPNKEL